jgi:PAS domain S-box-containing protein
MPSAFDETEPVFKTIVEHTTDVIARYDRDLRYLYANPAFELVTGMASGNVLGKTHREAGFSEILCSQWNEALRKVFESGIVDEVEFEFEVEGAPRAFHSRLVPEKDETGKTVSVLVLTRDMTTQKTLQADLRRYREQLEKMVIERNERLTHAESNLWQERDRLKISEERFQQVAENTCEWIWEVDASGLYTYSNAAVEKILGYAPEEIVGRKHFYDLFSPDEREDLKREAFAAFEKKRPFRGFLNCNEHKDGRTVWFETSGVPMFDADGTFRGYRGADTDITEQKASEYMLRKNADEIQWLLKSMINAFVIFESVFDDDGVFVSYRFISINDAYERITGVKNEEVRGKTVHEVWPETEPEWVKRYGEVAVTGISQEFDLYHDPTKKFYHCNVYRPYDTQDRFCVVFEDITDRRRTEEALRESEARFRGVFESDMLGMLFWDVAGNITDCNQAFERMTGYASDELRSGAVRWRDITPPEYAEVDERAFQQILDHGKCELFEKEYICKDGSRLPILLGSAALQGTKGAGVAFVLDISDRKSAENELRTAKAFLDSVVELSPFPMWISDKNGTLIRSNVALRQALHVTDDRIVGKYNILKDDNLRDQGLMPLVQGVFEKQTTASFSMTWKSARAGEVDFSGANDVIIAASLFPIVNPDGEITNVVCQWIDVSERVKAESSLRESERRFRELFENLRDGWVRADLAGRILECNAAYRRMLGYTLSELKELRFQDITPKKWHAIEAKIVHERILRRGYSRIYEKEYVRNDGTVFPIELSTYRINDADGNPVGMWCLVRDITERQRTEEELRQRADLLLRMGRMAKIGGWSADLASGKVRWTDETYRIHEVEKDFKPDLDNAVAFFDPRDIPVLRAAMQRAFEQNKPYDLDLRLTTGKGNLRWVRSIGRRVGKVGAQLEGSFQDITELKEVEQLRERFIREASHSLKTPVAMLDMAMGLLKQGIGSRDTRKIEMAWRIASDNVHSIMRDITKILQTSAIDVLKLSMQRLKGKGSLRREAERYVAQVRHFIEGKHLNVQIDISEKADSVAMGSHDLRILIGNLLDNAIKFTEKGSIAIKGRVRGTHVELRVEDTGKGISAAQAEQVFEKFFQAHPSVEGVGLGLSICKDIVELYGGTIALTSQGMGKGAVVTVVLPRHVKNSGKR